MNELILVSEVAALTKRSEKSVYNIITTAGLKSDKIDGKKAVHSSDIPFINNYPRCRRRTKAEIQRAKNAAVDKEFAERFGAKQMQLNQANVPAGAQQPLKQPAPARPQADSETITISLKKGEDGKYEPVMPNGWRLENGKIVKDRGLPQSYADYCENFEDDAVGSDTYGGLFGCCSKLADLVWIRDLYNGGWKPNWESNEQRPNIFFNKMHVPTRGSQVDYPALFVFKDAETRDAFFNNFQNELQTISKLLS